MIQLPRTGIIPGSRGHHALLLISYYDPSSISTVPETIAFLQEYSHFTLSVVNLFEGRVDTGYLKVGADIDFSSFAAVIIHNSVSYNVDNLRSLDTLSPLRLADYSGVKILFKQDENYRLHDVAEYIGIVGFDIIFTCVSEAEQSKVYPPELVGSPRFVQMLTGYITPTLRSLDVRDTQRTLDIGYRGSIQPLSFGRLAWEKKKIGDDVLRLLEMRGLALDISSRWEDRISGGEWLGFLSHCKATLGAESGASIFDLDGDLDERCARLNSELGPYREDKDYVESFLARLNDLEGNVRYAQISPRHFEATACHTLQLLYPGSYSGIFKSGRHYFPLSRDYSNLEEAVDLLRDDKRRRDFTDSAYEEVILDKRYWIETFANQFDQEVDQALANRKSQTARIPQYPAIERNVLLLAAHEPPRDPRCTWTANGSPPGFLIHQLGISRVEDDPPTAVRMPRGEMVWTFPRIIAESEIGILKQMVTSGVHSPALAELHLLCSVSSLPGRSFAKAHGVSSSHPRLRQLRWYMRYIVNITLALVHHATTIKGFHGVIATDLDTLLAALALKDMYGIPVIYDAHEFWPEADVEQDEIEHQFWLALEQRLLNYVDYAQTVSPGLASIMSETYGVPVSCVPNAEPLHNAIPMESLRDPVGSASPECHFLFQGGFSPARGIDLLIKAWPATMNSAILELRGPDNAYKEEMKALAESVGLLGTRIFFPAAVSEDALIQTAALADVALLPYTSTGTNYANCCPNKLSQYMAAGLPILANRTNFVADLISKADCGEVVDFSKSAALASLIDRFSINVQGRREQGRRAHTYFCRTFHWEAVSKEFYTQIKVLVQNQPPTRLEEVPQNAVVLYELDSSKMKSSLISRQSIGWDIVRTLWHLIPAPIRYWLIRAIRIT